MSKTFSCTITPSYTPGTKYVGFAVAAIASSMDFSVAGSGSGGFSGLVKGDVIRVKPSHGYELASPWSLTLAFPDANTPAMTVTHYDSDGVTVKNSGSIPAGGGSDSFSNVEAGDTFATA